MVIAFTTDGPYPIGTVTGNGLLPNMFLGVDHQRLPRDLVPPDLWSVPLAGSGSNRTFSQTVRLPLGDVAINATEDNTGGKEGTAKLSLLNLPPTLRDPGGALGPLQGVLDASPGCRIAVYQSGAIATDGANVFTISQTILPKWNQWKSAGKASSPDAYCPTENERNMRGSSVEPAPGPTRVQNFRGGRIFANLPDGSHYLPAVFASAIDQLAG